MYVSTIDGARLFRDVCRLNDVAPGLGQVGEHWIPFVSDMTYIYKGYYYEREFINYIVNRFIYNFFIPYKEVKKFFYRIIYYMKHIY